MKRIVLGNGIVGLTTAVGLLRRANHDDEIVIVGEPSRPGSATLAAAAMLNSYAEIEAGGLKHEVDAIRFELSRKATQMWPEFDLALTNATHATPSHAANAPHNSAGNFGLGTFVVNNTAADDLDDENFDAILAVLKEFNEPHSLVSPSDIPGYKPHQRYRATRALLIRDEGWFNPRLMVEKMEGALRNSAKVIFVDGSVDRLIEENGLIKRVLLYGGGSLEGDQYLLATGATVTEVVERSGLDLGLQRVFFGIGTSIEIRSSDVVLKKVVRTPNRGLACGLYTAPYFQGPGQPDGHILVGASNFIAPTIHYHGRLTSVETLMGGVMRQVNSDLYRADLIRVNVGARPTSQDTYPMIGPTRMRNLFVATGTKRDGIHMAPLISDVMSAMMCGLDVDERWALFRPDRQPIRTMSREQAVEKAVRHHISAAYQHGFEPATTRMSEQLEQQLRRNVEQLHDEIGADTWGIPPEMLDMYRYGHAKT